MKTLHFADAHIDIHARGKLDPETGLPMRVMDFLRSLDTIIETAIDEKVELAIFAGDAYKSHNPAPTYQREWEKRIIKLSNAEIPTILLVGNHDMTPRLGRAHALEEFKTLDIPHVHIVDKPIMLTPAELGIDVQILAIPWLTRSGMLAHLDMPLSGDYNVELETRLTALVGKWLNDINPEIPTILTAHASVQGAVYGGERSIMLGSDMIISTGLVKNPLLDYVALGHIHKSQNLNEGAHPPVIYPGSIERVDFGEAKDKKFFVIADVEKGKTTVDWRELTEIRKFIDCELTLTSDGLITSEVMGALPEVTERNDAIVRLVLNYPMEFEPLIDEKTIHSHMNNAFEFRLIKRPVTEARSRLPEGKNIGTYTKEQLLEIYFEDAGDENKEDVLSTAKEIIDAADKKTAKKDSNEQD